MRLNLRNNLKFAIAGLLLGPAVSFSAADVGYTLTQSNKDDLWGHGVSGHVEISEKIDFAGRLNLTQASSFEASDYKAGIDWQVHSTLDLNLSLIGSRIKNEEKAGGLAVGFNWNLSPDDQDQKRTEVGFYISTQRGTNNFDDTVIRKNTSRISLSHDFTQHFTGGIFASATKVSDRTPGRYRIFQKNNESLILSSEKSAGVTGSYRWTEKHETELILEYVKSDDDFIKIIQPGLTYIFTPDLPWSGELSLIDTWDLAYSPRHSLLTIGTVTYHF